MTSKVAPPNFEEWHLQNYGHKPSLFPQDQHETVLRYQQYKREIKERDEKASD